MIVHCPRCQARFRVSDEKIGPRGAKVRCSRCKDVFVVRREKEAPAPAPKIDLVELTPGLARPVPRPDPFVAAEVGAFSTVAPPPAPPPATDPFAAVGLESFGGPGPSAPAPYDPFAPVAAPTAPVAAGASPAPADPFAAGADPFAAAEPSRAPSALPVTDLAQLIGAVSPAAPSPTDAGVSAPAAPAFADLALEERGTPGPVPFADPSDVLAAGPGPAAIDGAALQAAPVAQVPVGEESLALATEPSWSSPVETVGAAEPGPGPEPAPPAEAPPAAPAPRAHEPAGEAATPAPPLPGAAARLRSAAFDALALVVLLAVALAFRVVWRGEAALGPAAFRPSTLLRGLSAEQAPRGPFEVVGVRSGLYEQSGGDVVLFARGEVISHAAAPVDAVHVQAELLRDGQVLARGEAQAGGVPTPEEVYRATDRAALEQLAAELRTRAPRVVAPGDRLGFLVILGDAPADVAGASVRVRASAGGAEGAR
ncbi:MAG TPA: zinc-ribbon domain-containing protein [Anaeromyxobacter sp.]|nr:zinc-ribbon domain-containing protein [Anaeromyxobacter sp.]